MLGIEPLFGFLDSRTNGRALALLGHLQQYGLSFLLYHILGILKMTLLF
jgi:hypothetical protein